MKIDTQKDLLNPNNLYNHIFDIDDVIRALCGDDNTGIWLLSTIDGRLTQQQNMDDIETNDHLYIINPLPNCYIKELIKSRIDLDDLAKHSLLTMLKNTVNLHNLIQEFYNDKYGEWLYNKLKDEAIEWLGENNLIPPSMIRNSGGCGGKPSSKLKVKIT